MPKEKTKTDLDDFENFFKEKGVRYSRNKHGSYKTDDGQRKQSKWTLSVAQAIFHFNADEQYLGVEMDEMGFFHEREQ